MFSRQRPHDQIEKCIESTIERWDFVPKFTKIDDFEQLPSNFYSNYWWQHEKKKTDSVNGIRFGVPMITILYVLQHCTCCVYVPWCCDYIKNRAGKQSKIRLLQFSNQFRQHHCSCWLYSHFLCVYVSGLKKQKHIHFLMLSQYGWTTVQSMFWIKHSMCSHFHFLSLAMYSTNIFVKTIYFER